MDSNALRDMVRWFRRWGWLMWHCPHRGSPHCRARTPRRAQFHYRTGLGYMGDSPLHTPVVHVGCRSLKTKDKHKIEIVHIEFTKCTNNASEFSSYSFLMTVNKF